MKTEIQQPAVPAFLKVRLGSGSETTLVPVKDFSEEELREVGRRWTEDLVARSKRRI